MSDYTPKQVIELGRRLEAEGDTEGAKRAARIAASMMGSKPAVKPHLSDYAKSALEGATGQVIGDEALAKAQTMLKGGDYEANLSDMRQREEAFGDARPWGDALTEAGGGLAAGLAAAKALPLPRKIKPVQSLLARSAAGAGVGGLMGATAGFMEGEGDVSEGGTRPVGAAQGAVVGGAVGSVLPGAGAGLGKLTELASKTPAMARLRDIDVGQNASKLLARAMEMDMPFAPDRVQAAGKYATMADAGPNTMGLLDLAANSPNRGAGEAKGAIAGIANEAGADLTNELNRVMGVPFGPKGLQSDVMKSTAADRSAKYTAFQNSPVDYSSEAGLKLEAVLDRLDPQVIKDAIRIARMQGIENPQKFASIADDGTATITSPPSAGMIDSIQRALRNASATTGSEISMAQRGLRSELLSAADEAIDGFAEARKAGRNAIQGREAVDVGRSMFSTRTTREDVADAVEGYDASQRVLMARGARGYIEDIMARVRPAITSNDMDSAREALAAIKQIGSREARDKMEILLGTNEAKMLYNQLDQTIIALSKNAAISQNSKTAIRQMFGDFAKEFSSQSMGEQIVQNGPIQQVFKVAQQIASAGGENADDRMKEMLSQIAQALTRRDIDVEKAMQMVRDVNPQIERAIKRGQIVDNSVQRLRLPAVSGAAGDE